MADNRIEFELAMKDMATKELQRFKQELAATTSASSNFNKNIGDGEQLLKNFYREQRVQDRTMREATQALTGFTVGLSGLMMSGSGTSKTVKDLNSTILASVTAMQGAEFASASLGIAGRNLGGRLGSVAQALSANAGYIGAIIGAATATLGLAKALADYLYPQIDKSFKFKTAAADVDQLANAFKQFKSGEAYKAELQAFIAEFKKTLDFQVKLRTDVGMSKDLIAEFIREETQKFTFAKKELERITNAGKQTKAKKPSVDMGGDELKEAFEKEKQMRRDMINFKLDLMIEEEAAREEAFQREMQRLSTYKDAAFITFQSIGQAIGESLAGQDENARDVLKRMANMFISMAESALFAASAIAAAKDIATFGASLISDGPKLIAAFTALETGRALINKMHNGGIVGDFANTPASREFPIMVRGGETVRTEGQERDLQNSKGRGGSVVVNVNFNAPVSDDVFVMNGITKAMRKTGLPITELAVNNRSKISLS